MELPGQLIRHLRETLFDTELSMGKIWLKVPLGYNLRSRDNSDMDSIEQASLLLVI